MKGNRNRASQAAGRRFELAVMKCICGRGFECERVDETSGFTHGVDILVFVRHRRTGRRVQLPIAIQCKATKTKSSLRLGLIQAIEGWPFAQAWVCVHSFRRGRKPVIRVAWAEGSDCEAPAILDMEQFLDRLEDFSQYYERG